MKEWKSINANGLPSPRNCKITPQLLSSRAARYDNFESNFC